MGFGEITIPIYRRVKLINKSENYRIVFVDVKSYHSLAFKHTGIASALRVEAGNQTLDGEAPASFNLLEKEEIRSKQIYE